MAGVPTGYTNASYGQQEAAASATQLPANNASVVQVRALKTNTGTIWLAFDNAVSNANGYPLAAGDELDLQIGNTARIWIVGTSGDFLAWMALY